MKRLLKDFTEDIPLTEKIIPDLKNGIEAINSDSQLLTPNS
nr:hypothetical protein [Okeania sp. SIO2F4]